MRIFALVAATLCITGLLVGGSPKPKYSQHTLDTLAISHAAHEAYVSAINSNNLDSLMGALTEDIVFLSPHEPVVIGKSAVHTWCDTYLKAYKIHWDKKTDEFTIAGDWAIERYSYKEDDTPVGGGEHVKDTGKGINIYHHDADGKWRVARDAWNSDLPVPSK